jgi:hypothetical protein
MRLLDLLKKHLFRTKAQQEYLQTSFEEAETEMTFTREFTKDDDTFMFI